MDGDEAESVKMEDVRRLQEVNGDVFAASWTSMVLDMSQF